MWSAASTRSLFETELTEKWELLAQVALRVNQGPRENPALPGLTEPLEQLGSQAVAAMSSALVRSK